MKRKTCVQCKNDFSYKHFDRNPSGKDGYRNVCKTCEKDRRKRKGIKKVYPFFSAEILHMCSTLKYIEVTKCDIFYGIIIHLRPREKLAFSVVAYQGGGSKVHPNVREARFWLYKKMIEAGERTQAAVMKFISI